MRFLTKRFFICLVIANVTGPCLAESPGSRSLLKRGGVDVIDRDGPFSLAVGVGSVGIDDFDDNRLALNLTPRFKLRAAARSAVNLTLPILWLPNSHLGGREIPFNELQDLCAALGLDCPENSKLEVGPSIAVAANVEWIFRTNCCVRPSVSLGAGFWYDRGHTTQIPDAGFGNVGDLAGGGIEIEDEIAPIVSFAAAISRPLTTRTALRLEVRAVTAFYDDLTVEVVGIPAALGGGSVTSGFLTVGVEFSP